MVAGLATKPPSRDARGRMRIGHAVRRPMPRAKFPRAVEADYATAIVSLVHGALRTAIVPLMRRMPALLERARAARGDRGDAFETDELTSLIDGTARSLSTALDTHSVELLARRYGAQTSATQRAELSRQTRAVLGVDIATLDRKVPTLIDHFSAENAQLIKSLGEAARGDVAKIASRAFTSGATVDDLTSDIEDRFGVVERHARLIARDQVGKLNGKIAAARHQELGVTRFYWRDCGDGKVRPEHEDLASGGPYSYADPPSEGIPGVPACCRCSADPVLADVLGSIGDDE
ncbi:MAG TPA: minor capsid protein [Kofleriaceae bacterium]